MIGETIGNFRITQMLGEGGMGAVYLAEHTSLNRKAAVKVLLPEFSQNREIIARFLSEAKATSAIEHPGIITVYDCGFDHQNRAYITMTYLDGETLDARLAKAGRMSAETVAIIGQELAEALSAAHTRGIVHRDLKPANIMLIREGERERVKILDFGLAKLQGDLAIGAMKTATGTVMGTPPYMAPEQCMAGKIDARSDVYSLGCVLYELLCGQPPFNYEEFGRMFTAHMMEPPTPLRKIEPSVPEGFEGVILRMIAKKPDERYQDMEQVAAAMGAIAQGKMLPPQPLLDPDAPTFVPPSAGSAGVPSPLGAAEAPAPAQAAVRRDSSAAVQEAVRRNSSVPISVTIPRAGSAPIPLAPRGGTVPWLLIGLVGALLIVLVTMLVILLG